LNRRAFTQAILPKQIPSSYRNVVSGPTLLQRLGQAKNPFASQVLVRGLVYHPQIALSALKR
jgi:hypothetical protein